MAIFDTPEPISVVLEIAIGDIRIMASDRADTIVDVQPTDLSNPADVRAAEQVRVEHSRGKLTVRPPAQFRALASIVSRAGSVDVTVELPSGSHVRAGSVSASLHSEGRLGDVRFDTANSDIRLDRTGPLRLSAAGGDMTVARVVGNAKITNSAGGVRIDRIDGSAVVKNDHGESTIGEVTGPLLLKGMNGDMHVERAHGNVDARTAHGNVRIGEIMRGTVALTTAFGQIEIGIREGTAAKLYARTVSGQVRNSLSTVDGPEQSDQIVEVTARTFDGDIVIRRS
jgi:DUF4097 and DUF4098 domain-containing protein YvlB